MDPDDPVPTLCGNVLIASWYFTEATERDVHGCTHTRAGFPERQWSSPPHTEKGASPEGIIMSKAIILAGLILAKLPLAATAVLGRPKRTARRIRLSGSGISTHDSASRTFVVLATGDVGRLGRLTLQAEGMFAPADSVLSFTGATTLVANNGDELTGTFQGTSTPLTGEADATFLLTITGGSGRFQSASGTMNVIVHGALMSTRNTLFVYDNQFTGSGTLSY
jgi:hypothetical protein